MNKKLVWRCRSYLLACMILINMLCGCGRTSTQETAQTGEKSQNSDALALVNTENQMEQRGTHKVKELKSLDPDLCIQSLKKDGEKLDPSEFCITDGVLYRQARIYTVEKMNGYSEIFTQGVHLEKTQSPYDEWEVQTERTVLLEGASYSVGDLYFYGGEPKYCRLIGEAEDYWAQIGADGTKQILGKFPEELQDGYVFEVVQPDKIYAYHTGTHKIVRLNGKLELEREYVQKGQILGLVQDTEGEEVSWYGYDENRKFGIFRLNGEIVWQDTQKDTFSGSVIVKMGKDGEFYACSAETLWVLGKEKELLCNFVLNDYPWKTMEALDVDADGRILILGTLDHEYCLAEVVKRETADSDTGEKQEIVFAALSQHKALMKSISRFNRRSKNYHITGLVKDETEDYEEFEKRIRLEMTAGRGPDFMEDRFLSDIDGYVQNGFFADMSDVITDAQEFIPAALDGGQKNGKQYGIPYDFQFQFVTYSQDFTQGRESWTLSDLMDAVRNSDAKMLQYGYDAMDLVLWYGLYDNENTAFIDWEKKESHLNQAPFREFLEFAVKYADPDVKEHPNARQGFGRQEEGKLLASGRSLATVSIMDNFDDLRDLAACFDGKEAILGYPAANGNGIYAKARYLYVNSNTACREGVAEFLRFLLTEEEQINYSKKFTLEDVDAGWTGLAANLPVNFNALRYRIAEDQTKGSSEIYASGDRGVGYQWEPLTEKQQEQILWLAQHAKPTNWHAGEIKDILQEELDPYFAGQRGLEEMTEILHKRVQLYLEERK